MFNLAKVTEQIVNTQAGMLNWLQELHGSVNGGPAPTPKAPQAAKAVQTMDAIAAMDAVDEPNTLVVTLRITADRPIKDKNRMAEVISNRISTLDTVRLVELR